MSNHISKLEIRINFLNRKKNEELESLKVLKEKETQALRGKLSTMLQYTERVGRWQRNESTPDYDHV